MSPHFNSSLMQMIRPKSPERSEKPISDRHFVTWSDQEDEILRQAVAKFGEDKWSMIAAQFTNKTSRQCRRRWNTYLSTDCKKGGWTPEEDQLLLEAHRKFGNRWTEIAKVVAGRTDNAVKNRFCALSKKQAKKSDAASTLNNVDDGKTPRRKVLEPNDNLANKKIRGDYGNILSTNGTPNQQRQFHVPVKPWAVDQSMAHRAHPVQKHVPLSTQKIQMQSKTIPNRRVSLHGNSTFGVKLTDLKNASSFSENVSPPRLAALTRNAALLDSLVERRDTLMKLWGNNDDTWKSFDWFSMEQEGKPLQARYASGCISIDDVKDVLYDSKENYPNLVSSHYPGQTMNTIPTIHEPAHMQAHHENLGTLTPTGQYERSWKVRSEHESGPDRSSSPSNLLSNNKEDSAFLQNDCFSPSQVEHLAMSDQNDCKTRISSNTDADADDSMGLLSTAFYNISSPTNFTWDSQVFLDEMPSPEFSDSEKQFLLSALDCNYQQPVVPLYSFS